MKARFITCPQNILLTPVPFSTDWIVRKEIVYFSEVLNTIIIVQPDFITDLASVPKCFWWLYPPTGIYDKAVILHDWLFWMQPCSFQEANMVLQEAMLVCGCKQSTADHFYMAVSLGSKGVWKKYAKMTELERKTKGFAQYLNGQIIVP